MFSCAYVVNLTGEIYEIRLLTTFDLLVSRLPVKNEFSVFVATLTIPLQMNGLLARLSSCATGHAPYVLG